MAYVGKFRLAVQGDRNLTAVGPILDTIRQATEYAKQYNQARATDGRKPIVAIKRLSRTGSTVVQWLDGGDDDE